MYTILHTSHKVAVKWGSKLSLSGERLESCKHPHQAGQLSLLLVTVGYKINNSGVKLTVADECLLNRARNKKCLKKTKS